MQFRNVRGTIPQSAADFVDNGVIRRAMRIHTTEIGYGGVLIPVDMPHQADIGSDPYKVGDSPSAIHGL